MLVGYISTRKDLPFGISDALVVIEVSGSREMRADAAQDSQEDLWPDFT